MSRVVTRKNPSVRLVNVKSELASNITGACLIGGALLSTLGAFYAEHAASLGDAKYPVLLGAALLLIGAYRCGLIRR